MANPRLIKKRVGSIKNIRKITKALEMVSASKVQKAQDKAMNSKPYAEKVYEIVQDFAQKADTSTIPLMKIPETRNNVLMVIFSTNRGLAGSLNSNLFRHMTSFINKRDYKNIEYVTVGKKGQNVAVSSGKLIADFSDYQPTESAASSLVNLISQKFVNEEVDEVYLVYNDFISALEQRPTIKKLLPIEQVDLNKESAELIDEKDEKIESNIEYNFEPSAEKVLAQLLPFYLEVVVTEVIFEAEASEHSARMIAMKNASENAEGLSETLSLEYNKARQQAITNEINDIVTASLTVS